MTFAVAEVERLPTAQLDEQTPLIRIHRRGREPWYSSRGTGRFDPGGAENAIGACYLAEDPLGAFVEVYRRQRHISEADLEARQLATLTARRRLNVVDLTARRAVTSGPDITSLSSDWRYDCAQQFATVAVAAGLDGIRYFARHDLAKELVSVALFGPADGSGLIASTASQDVPEDLVRQASAEFGYRVLPIP